MSVLSGEISTNQNDQNRCVITAILKGKLEILRKKSKNIEAKTVFKKLISTRWKAVKKLWKLPGDFESKRDESGSIVYD